VSRLRTHGSIAAVSGLALAGNVLPGFAAACVARTRTAEPGLVAGAAVVLVLMMPASYRRSRWIRTFPAPGTGRPSSDPAWWIVLAVCVVATAISAGGRGLPRWRASAAIPASGAPCGYAGLGLASRVTCQAPHSARRQDDQPSQL
jgi:hypothetical protein